VESALFAIAPLDERPPGLARAPGLSRDVSGPRPTLGEFGGFVKALFSQRRKVLRTALAKAASVHAGGFEEEARSLARSALRSAGVDGRARVEDLRPAEVLGLWRELAGCGSA
jgi:16S rRNA A1518/A1519 N6-dimethyltransferase RsmA/KsgA/DIM1 with predicted DNA glycosylase/AP lyase activity